MGRGSIRRASRLQARTTGAPVRQAHAGAPLTNNPGLRQVARIGAEIRLRGGHDLDWTAGDIDERGNVTYTASCRYGGAPERLEATGSGHATSYIGLRRAMATLLLQVSTKATRAQHGTAGPNAN